MDVGGMEGQHGGGGYGSRSKKDPGGGGSSTGAPEGTILEFFKYTANLKNGTGGGPNMVEDIATNEKEDMELRGRECTMVEGDVTNGNNGTDDGGRGRNMVEHGMSDENDGGGHSTLNGMTTILKWRTMMSNAPTRGKMLNSVKFKKKKPTKGKGAKSRSGRDTNSKGSVSSQLLFSSWISNEGGGTPRGITTPKDAK